MSSGSLMSYFYWDAFNSKDCIDIAKKHNRNDLYICIDKKIGLIQYIGIFGGTLKKEYQRWIWSW